MDTRKHQANTKYLPNDVLCNNIFIRLPAKQVAQMRSLSKLWNSFLSHPSFIKSHLHHSVQNKDDILIVFYDDLFSYKQPFTTHLSRSPYLQLTNLIKFPNHSSSKEDPQCYVIGSVNGLICYSKWDNGDVIHIWNPSLSALIALPPYNISHESDEYNIILRFGFDPKTDDYKVFKVTFCHGGDFNIVIDSLQVEVYSMRNGLWESISERFPSHITMIYSQDEVFTDGHDGYLHWLCYVDEYWKLQTIVVFDLGVGTFSEISLPNSIQHVFGMKYLGVLSRKLCVMSCSIDEYGDFFGDCEVWVMDKYGWAKNHIFSQFSSNIVPIGFTLNNEFLFRFQLRLVLYDPNAAAVKLFNITRPYESTNVVHYVDSLVWVAPDTIPSSQIH